MVFSVAVSGGTAPYQYKWMLKDAGSNWRTASGGTTDTLERMFPVQEAIDSNYRNGGLEAVEYYKDDILFVGSQENAYLWQYRFDGTMISKISLQDFTTEVAGLHYDAEADWLWVVDSNQQKIFICQVDGTLVTSYDVPFIENAESICVDRSRSCVWVGSDEDSPKLYRFEFKF